MGDGSIEWIAGIPRRRMETLPVASMVMEALIKTIEPKPLIFSGYGMREGQLLKILPDKVS